MNLLLEIAQTFVAPWQNVLPILVLLASFQLFVLRQPIPRLRRVVVGFGFVLVGLTLFLVGLEKALFPVGKIMAKQLSAPDFVLGTEMAPQSPEWWAYGWIYLFAALIGFAATIAEPTLIAVAYKANQVSGGTISQWGLRLAVALGVALGIALGAFRIITGTPLIAYIVAGYLVLLVLTVFAPKAIIPLAYDSGGVTTSSVTVPLVAALGLALSATIPGRNPALDGFGLIAFASLFPMITVMGYVQLVRWWARIRLKSTREV